MRMRFPSVAALIAAFTLAGSVGASAAPEPIVVGVVISTSGPSAPLGVPQKKRVRDRRERRQRARRHRRPAVALRDRRRRSEARRCGAARATADRQGRGRHHLRNAHGDVRRGDARHRRRERRATLPHARRPNCGRRPRAWRRRSSRWRPPPTMKRTRTLHSRRTKLKAKTIAIVHDENQYGTVAAAATEAAARDNGVTVVANESYPGDATDFTPQIAARGSGGSPTPFMLLGATNTPALLTVQARTLGVKVPVVGSSAILSPAFLRVRRSG